MTEKELLKNGFDCKRFYIRSDRLGIRMEGSPVGGYVEYKQAQQILELARKYEQDSRRYQWLKSFCMMCDEFSLKDIYTSNQLDEYIDEQIERIHIQKDIYDTNPREGTI